MFGSGEMRENDCVVFTHIDVLFLHLQLDVHCQNFENLEMQKCLIEDKVAQQCGRRSPAKKLINICRFKNILKKSKIESVFACFSFLTQNGLGKETEGSIFSKNPVKIDISLNSNFSEYGWEKKIQSSMN